MSSKGVVHPNHVGKSIICPNPHCRIELKGKTEAKDHLIEEYPRLAEHCVWLYYFYYCRECAYYTPQKANLKQHLKVKHNQVDTDVSYATYGGADFVLGTDGTPMLWRDIRSPLIALYGNASDLDRDYELTDDGIFCGDYRYYPQ